MQVTKRAGRKFIDPAKLRVNLCIRLKPETRGQLELIASMHRLQLGQTIDLIVRKYLEK